MRTMERGVADKWMGIGLVAAAALIWGMSAPVSKSLTNSAMSLLTLVFLRNMICAVSGGLFFLKFDRSVFRVSGRQFLFLFAYGTLVVAGTLVGFFYSVKYLTVSGALLLHYSFPILTMLGSLVLIREAPTPLQIVSAFLIVAGVGIGVFVSPHAMKSISLPGVLWGLVSVVGISTQTLFARMTANRAFVSQWALLFHGFLWSNLTTGICKTFSGGWGDLFLLTPTQWTWIFLLGLPCSLLPQLFYFLGLRRITAPLGSVISSLELVAASLFAAIFLHEIPTATEILGSVIVISAIALASLSSAQPVREPLCTGD